LSVTSEEVDAVAREGGTRDGWCRVWKMGVMGCDGSEDVEGGVMEVGVRRGVEAVGGADEGVVERKKGVAVVNEALWRCGGRKWVVMGRSWKQWRSG